MNEQEMARMDDGPRIPARLGLVTLGVADLERSVAFYQALGWEKAHRPSRA